MARAVEALIVAGIIGGGAYWWAQRQSAAAPAPARVQPASMQARPSAQDGLRRSLLESVGQLGADLLNEWEPGAPGEGGNMDLNAIWGTVSGWFSGGGGGGASRTGGGVGALLNVIGRAEAPGGYDTVYHGSVIQPPRPITSMTVGEVLQWQDESVRAGSASSAAGRYQIIRGTLRDLVAMGAVSRGEKFDKGAQDRAARALLERRGLSDYRAGRISREAFAQNLAQEWAGLPVAIKDRRGRSARGQSYYAGDGLNAATVPLEDVLGALEVV